MFISFLVQQRKLLVWQALWRRFDSKRSVLYIPFLANTLCTHSIIFGTSYTDHAGNIAHTKTIIWNIVWHNTSYIIFYESDELLMYGNASIVFYSYERIIPLGNSFPYARAQRDEGELWSVFYKFSVRTKTTRCSSCEVWSISTLYYSVISLMIRVM